jgi:hypothetical protein
VIKAGKNDGVPNKLLPDKLLKQGFFSVETQLAAFQFAPNRALRLSERAAAEAEMISSAFMIWLKRVFSRLRRSCLRLAICVFRIGVFD